jgi:hypothetical protein
MSDPAQTAATTNEALPATALERAEIVLAFVSMAIVVIAFLVMVFKCPS